MPKISVIIPVYNVEKYLRECLDSVVNQTLKDIEIICINDGSTDSSPEIINEYVAKDDRIKVINKSNSGYGDSMNKGLEAATGEYIGIVESDDYIKENMFETLYNKAVGEDFDIVKSNFYVLTGNGCDKKIKPVKLDDTNKYYNKNINPINEPRVFTFPMYTWSGIYKKEFLNHNQIRHNTTPGASFQDNGFFFQTFCLAKKICFIDEGFYYYRCDNANASCNDLSERNILKSQAEYAFIYQFVLKHPELMPNINYVYNWQKMQMYLPWFNEKTADNWIKIAHREFKEAFEKNEIDFRLFNKDRTKLLKTIIENPSKFRKAYHDVIRQKVGFLKRIFSVTNKYYDNDKYKIIRILFLKFKIKVKKNNAL